jgi:uncharacterized damage-inducible protein DinB
MGSAACREPKPGLSFERTEIEEGQMKRAVFGFFAIMTLALAVGAQQNAAPATNPVSDAVRRLVATESKNIIAGAEAMPADKYDFRPTPAQNTFGHLVVHMIGANYFMCAAIGGVPMPKAEQPKETDPKDTLTTALKASFDFCTQSLASVDDSKLGEQVPFFGGRNFPRGSVIIIFAQDYGDHYAQEAAYLRAAGLLPPSAQRKAGQ